MLTSSLTKKGQLTLPAKLRKEMGVKAADRIVFIRDHGKVVIQRLPTMASLYGSLANSKVKPLSEAKIEEIIEKGMFSKNDRT